MGKSNAALVGVALLLGAAQASAQDQADAGAPNPQGTQTTETQTQPQPQPTAGGGDANLGGPGESCRARADCKSGLKCMNKVCTDEHEGESCGATSDCGGRLKCIDNKCTSAVGGHPGGGGGGGEGGGMGDWMKFRIDDGAAHPFAGITLAGGFGTGGLTGNGVFGGGFDTFDGAFLFALHAGVFLGNNQLSFEVAPVTFFYDMKGIGPVFEMAANYAYFVPLTDSGDIHVYWPLRFGAGMMAGPDLNAFGLAFFQARADLIGAAIQVGHVLIDLSLPSFRYMITDKNGTQAHFLDWLFGTNLSYVF
jgi:hypothetical protein